MATSASQRELDSALLAARAAQVQRGGARAAVLGVNDGLVSTVCIVLGVAAAGADQSAVFLAGFAGLVAGAISMAAGEWISVKSQVDLFEGILTDLRTMVGSDKKLLEDNLTAHLTDTGYSKNTAANATTEIAKNDDGFANTYATQVIGMNPDELGSPWVAAGSSFALFTLGSLAPLLPWLFVDGVTAMVLSVTLTALGGLGAGAYVALSSGKSLITGAFRQFCIILLASAVTIGIGYLFGTLTS